VREGVDPLRAVALVGVRAGGLRVAVLTGVEQAELGQVAVGEAAVEPQVGPLRLCRGPQRLMLEVGLVGSRPPLEERLAGGRVAVLDRVVVVDLVVVPGDRERMAGVRGAQVGIGLVLRGADAVVGQARGLAGRLVGPTDRALRGPLVDVVAEVHHEVEVLVGHVPVGGVVARRVVLTGGEGESHPVRRPERRRRLGAAYRAGLRARLEAVEVLAPRPQALNLDMDRMGQLGPRLHRAATHYPGEALVLGHLETHPVGLGRQAAAAVLGQRLRRETRPEHHAVRPEIARGHPEAERVVGEERPGQRATGRGSARRDGQPSRAQPRPAQKPASAHARAVPVALDRHRSLFPRWPGPTARPRQRQPTVSVERSRDVKQA